RTVEGPIHRYTYGAAARRTARLAHALRALGVDFGDRVATLAWNSYRHFELYYGISGIGAVSHTINPRLHPSQIAYIVNHAADKFVFVDLTFVPILEAIAAHLPTVRGYVIMTGAQTMPQTKLPNVLCYETLLAEQPETIEWPEFDERTASSMCYSSGTTGEPKGVLYSHRSTVIHALAACSAERSRRTESNRCVMPIVPMFHVNGWGIPYTAPMLGTKLVLNGPAFEPEALYDLMETEGVASAGAVPIIWIRLLAYLEKTGKNLTTLRSLAVGGSAAPPALIEAFERRGIDVIHGWGMTETSPVCTTGALKAKHYDSPERLAYQMKVGRCVYGVEMKIVDPAGAALPHDGVAQGELCVRGPWVLSSYYENAEASAHAFTEDGWFRTGDICTLDPDGYLTITDRAKDLIKSGGEWISSIDLENAVLGHDEIDEAAAIAIPHPEYSERPLLVVRRRAGSALDRAAILAYLATKVAKWWLPDEIVFVEEMPYTATGKISKKTLRERYKDAGVAGGAR
ncbi:MAG: long-chain fatty acid--CoA ligase, partial [Candidatus Eremiobacteraeota bacterium]|nr:long-chain fatty acid--CoA ligase [Candidatus Eremiobacteraeota bacterium]